MQETTFVKPGTLRRPGPVGRTVRLLFGVLCCWGALGYGNNLSAFIRPDLPPFGLFFGPAIAFWLLPPVVNLGWGVNWKQRSRLCFLAVCAGAVVLDLVLYGSWWGPPLGVALWAATVYTLAHLGVSFLLAALLATPGCEMRALPELHGRLTGRGVMEHHCPGLIDPIDRWEAGMR